MDAREELEAIMNELAYGMWSKEHIKLTKMRMYHFNDYDLIPVFF